MHTEFAKVYSKTLHHGHKANIYHDKGDMFSTKKQKVATVIPWRNVPNPQNLLWFSCSLCGLQLSGSFRQKVGGSSIISICHISFSWILLRWRISKVHKTKNRADISHNLSLRLQYSKSDSWVKELRNATNNLTSPDYISFDLTSVTRVIFKAQSIIHDLLFY